MTTLTYKILKRIFPYKYKTDYITKPFNILKEKDVVFLLFMNNPNTIDFSQQNIWVFKLIIDNINYGQYSDLVTFQINLDDNNIPIDLVQTKYFNGYGDMLPPFYFKTKKLGKLVHTAYIYKNEGMWMDKLLLLSTNKKKILKEINFIYKKLTTPLYENKNNIYINSIKQQINKLKLQLIKL